MHVSARAVVENVASYIKRHERYRFWKPGSIPCHFEVHRMSSLTDTHTHTQDAYINLYVYRMYPVK